MAYLRDLDRWPRVRRPAPPPPANSVSRQMTLHSERPISERFIRCPFALAPMRGIDMSVCPGYEVELVGVAVDDPNPQTAACLHLVSAPHPVRDAMVGVCHHPEAPWIVLAAQRMLTDRDVEASCAPAATADIAARVRTAQLRAAHLVGRSRIDAMAQRFRRAA